MGNSLNGITRFGVVSDIHGGVQNLNTILNKFNAIGVDAILSLGDLPKIAYEDERKSYQDMEDSLVPMLETGRPVLLIPGNYERRDVYKNVIGRLVQEFDNLYNLENSPAKRIGNVSVVGLGGVHINNIVIRGGFLHVTQDYQKLEEKIQDCEKDSVVLVASHGPMRYKTSNGLDYSHGMNAGSKELSQVRERNSVMFGVSGHFHENRGIINPLTEEKIDEVIYSDKLDFNPGDVCGSVVPRRKASAGILEFKGNSARAYFLEGDSR